jgi:hypothetical protein
MLPGSMRTAFQYITCLGHEDKPNYNLIKLYLSFDIEDEERIYESKLKITNERVARDIFFDQGSVNRSQNEERKAS